MLQARVAGRCQRWSVRGKAFRNRGLTDGSMFTLSTASWVLICGLYAAILFSTPPGLLAHEVKMPFPALSRPSSSLQRMLSALRAPVSVHGETRLEASDSAAPAGAGGMCRRDCSGGQACLMGARERGSKGGSEGGSCGPDPYSMSRSWSSEPRPSRHARQALGYTRLALRGGREVKMGDPDAFGKVCVWCVCARACVYMCVCVCVSVAGHP